MLRLHYLCFDTHQKITYPSQQSAPHNRYRYQHRCRCRCPYCSRAICIRRFQNWHVTDLHTHTHTHTENTHPHIGSWSANIRTRVKVEYGHCNDGPTHASQVPLIGQRPFRTFRSKLNHSLVGQQSIVCLYHDVVCLDK